MEITSSGINKNHSVQTLFGYFIPQLWCVPFYMCLIPIINLLNYAHKLSNLSIIYCINFAFNFTFIYNFILFLFYLSIFLHLYFYQTLNFKKYAEIFILFLVLSKERLTLLFSWKQVIYLFTKSFFFPLKVQKLKDK